MSEKQRVEWIDIAKGIVMLLVIVGHTMTTPIRYANKVNYDIYSLIYFFHMPLMFYLSGRTFGMFMNRNIEYTPQMWFKKKWHTLMTPFVVYAVLVYFIFTVGNMVPGLASVLTKEGYGRQSVTHWLVGMITMQGDDLYCIHLWFIYALFLMNIFSYFTTKYIKNNHKVVLFVISYAFLCLRILFLDINYWGIINLFMKCYFWFVFGTYVDISKLVKTWIGRIWTVVGCAYAWFFINNYGGYRDEIQSWCIPVVFGKGVFVSDVLLEVFKDVADIGIMIGVISIAGCLRGIVKRFFVYTGKNSYGIYLFHQPFFASGCGAILYSVVGLPVTIAIFITFALCYIVPIVIMKLLDTKYLSFLKPFLLGTPRKNRV